MKKLKYALEVNKYLDLEEGKMTLLEFKYFKTKKEAINYAKENNYLNEIYYYTKLHYNHDYIMLT